MKAVIIAGGKGTRLGLTNLPKPMVPLNGIPLLEHQFNLLKRYNIRQVYLLTGYLSSVIEDYFGSGESRGMELTYIVEREPLGTAGALVQLKGLLTDRFIVLYGDVVMDFNISKFIDFDAESESLGSLIVHPNDHPYDSDLVERHEDQIIRFISKPHPPGLFYENLVNAAVYILSPKIFEHIPQGIASDFGKDIFPSIIDKGGVLRAYASPEYIKDLGTPDRLSKVEADLLSGKIRRWNLENKRPAIFIDRDGVINKEVDNLRNIEDFEVLPGVTEAIKRINQSDFLAIVITNQPMVAKGFITIAELSNIHKSLETQLGESRAFLNHIYYCPHHPESGFEGEIKSLKIPCSCRKPEIGLIQQATQDYNIDLSRSYFIGDSTTDLLTAQNAKVTSVLVNTGFAGKDNRYQVKPDYQSQDLKEAVELIFNLQDNP